MNYKLIVPIIVGSLFFSGSIAARQDRLASGDENDSSDPYLLESTKRKKTINNDKKGETNFSPLTISAGKETASQRALENIGAVSSRDIGKNQDSLDATLRGIPGTFTQIDPGQGAIGVNIRGLSGLGRVNSMVDGITQSFYGTSTAATHHGSTNNMAGVLIDPNFLVGVDVIRGDSSGTSGVNALSGSANFRTIGVDDIVFPGNNIGVRSRFSIGNNGIGHSGMVSVAGKTGGGNDTSSMGGLIGISGSKIFANYDAGDGVSTKEFGMDKYLKQNPQSQLYKLDMNLNQFSSIELSARNYSNRFTRREINSKDYYLKYHYAPFSELLDINLSLSSSIGNQRYENQSLYTFKNTSARNRSDALELSNISRFSLGDFDLDFAQGGKVMKTQYKRTIDSYIPDPENKQSAIENNPFAPNGKQDISALYGGLKIKRDIFEADFNLNYTYSQVKGYKPACNPHVTCIPQGAADIARTNGSFNPTVALSAQVTPWLQPFISYSKSTRAPNIQEMFFANSGGESMNPFLKPEHAETYQAGFNINTLDLIIPGDALRFKALAYDTKLRNYIFSQSFMVCKNGKKCNTEEAFPPGGGNNISDDYSTNMYIYINSPHSNHLRGYELEMDYDAGFAFSRLSFSKQSTDQATSVASGFFGAGDITELPTEYLTLDSGMRFFDQSLTVGAVVKHTGKAKRLSPNIEFHEVTGELLKEELPKIPTVIDLYSTWQANQNFLLKFSVQNVTNRSYSEALNKMNMGGQQGDPDTAGNTARGRTFIFGGEVRF